MTSRPALDIGKTSGKCLAPQNAQFYPMICEKVNPKIAHPPKELSGPDQIYLPGIPRPMVFQAISGGLHSNFEAEGGWSHPLPCDLVNFQPAFPPGKTPGAFVKSKSGVRLYPAKHKVAATELKILVKKYCSSDSRAWSFALDSGLKAVAIVTRVIYNGNIINVIVYLPREGGQLPISSALGIIS
ncbi:MAG: hypothetical protein ACOZFS_09320 [Thermodesulfobacteriota bacterium]